MYSSERGGSSDSKDNGVRGLSSDREREERVVIEETEVTATNMVHSNRGERSDQRD